MSTITTTKSNQVNKIANYIFEREYQRPITLQHVKRLLKEGGGLSIKGKEDEKVTFFYQNGYKESFKIIGDEVSYLGK